MYNLHILLSDFTLHGIYNFIFLETYISFNGNVHDIIFGYDVREGISTLNIHK